VSFFGAVSFPGALFSALDGLCSRDEAMIDFEHAKEKVCAEEN